MLTAAHTTTGKETMECKIAAYQMNRPKKRLKRLKPTTAINLFGALDTLARCDREMSEYDAHAEAKGPTREEVAEAQASQFAAWREEMKSMM